MVLLTGLIWLVQMFNDIALRIGRAIAIVAIAAMVVAILTQVFFRYVLNNALPWPDEAARFAMLWMTALIAPTAYRHGGFVAIDVISGSLPPRVAALLSLLLLAISGAVLWTALPIGIAELTGFNAKFATASLYVPTFDGWMRVPRSWMMTSLLVCVVLLITVNAELILRSIVSLLGGEERLRPMSAVQVPEAE